MHRLRHCRMLSADRLLLQRVLERRLVDQQVCAAPSPGELEARPAVARIRKLPARFVLKHHSKRVPAVLHPDGPKRDDAQPAAEHVGDRKCGLLWLRRLVVVVHSLGSCGRLQLEVGTKDVWGLRPSDLSEACQPEVDLPWPDHEEGGHCIVLFRIAAFFGRGG
eukprot:CAMPEP_0197523550 /NCGR_PEP_ID=MMETSP1318-20131121/8455_1 /TAXON_ID=552666 /ORGANISM="Partenskyella glossopodia, Strain RCC365" /LENGTH=163 /DNA_ID=CAMNT_0043076271 /DNA_START=145 /DNA_END=632 /DNA_ORIENTATION=-